MTRIQATLHDSPITLFECPGAMYHRRKLDGSKYGDVDSEDNVIYCSTFKFTVRALAREPRATDTASCIAHPEQHGVFSPCWGRCDAVRTTRMAARRARRRSPRTCFPAQHLTHSGTFGPHAR